MRHLAPLPLALAALLLATSACMRRTVRGELTVPQDPSGPLWNATIQPRPGADVPLSGSATMSAVQGQPEQTVVMIELQGAGQNALLPWHVHQGQCARPGQIVGQPAQYEPLRPTPDRTARSTVVLPIATPSEGIYSVNVHLSPERMGTIVACGNLTRTEPAGSTGR